jgi:hypothetical protein
MIVQSRKTEEVAGSLLFPVATWRGRIFFFLPKNLGGELHVGPIRKAVKNGIWVYLTRHEIHT